MKPNLPRVAAIAAGLRVTALFFFFLLGSEAVVAEDATQPAPQEYRKYGLLRERDLSPFGFLRLDMRPAHAVWAPPGSWGVEVLLGYQNTWVMSPNVEQYFESLPGRRHLGTADVDAIRALPGEAYLVDLELGLVDVALHWTADRPLECQRHTSVACVTGVDFLMARSRTSTRLSVSARSADPQSHATASTSFSTSRA